MRTVTDSELVVLMTPVVLAAEWWASGGTGPEKLDALKKAVRDYRRVGRRCKVGERRTVSEWESMCADGRRQRFRLVSVGGQLQVHAESHGKFWPVEFEDDHWIYESVIAALAQRVEQLEVPRG